MRYDSYLVPSTISFHVQYGMTTSTGPGSLYSNITGRRFNYCEGVTPSHVYVKSVIYECHAGAF